MRHFIVFLVFIVIFYSGLNYYIGLRGWQVVRKLVLFPIKKAYWFIFWVLAFTFVVGRIIPEKVGKVFSLIGSYWIAIMVNCIIILVFIDLVRLIDRFIGVIPYKLKSNRNFTIGIFIWVLVSVFCIIVYGAWNASNPRVTNYTVHIDKNTSKLSDLKIVIISDIHLGNIIGKERLDKYVDMINNLEADLVVIDGDIIDESIEPFIDENMGESFKRLKTKYGVYAILGNHDYFSREADRLTSILQKNNIVVLRDKVVKVEDSLYLIGREDKSINGVDGLERLGLSELKNGVDDSLPIILLDHQPTSISESIQNGIDLQFSGHTHKGQMFPVQYIVHNMYELDWGYLKKDNFQLIVSSGIGTWGPPIRTGCFSEIVVANVKFYNE